MEAAVKEKREILDNVLGNKTAAELRESVSELRARLEAAEKAERTEAENRRKAVSRKWKFTLAPAPGGGFSEALWDATMEWLQLTGEVVNKEELITAGWGANSDHMKGGAMRYLYNTRTERIVMRSGGGSLFLIGESGWGGRQTNQDELMDTLCQLEDFLRNNPHGGDVTSIIINQKGFSW